MLLCVGTSLCTFPIHLHIDTTRFKYVRKSNETVIFISHLFNLLFFSSAARSLARCCTTRNTHTKNYTQMKLFSSSSDLSVVACCAVCECRMPRCVHFVCLVLARFFTHFGGSFPFENILYLFIE